MRKRRGRLRWRVITLIPYSSSRLEVGICFWLEFFEWFAVTNTEVTHDIDGVIEKPDLDSASSIVIMEYLTKRCLDFELKFGKYPGRYG